MGNERIELRPIGHVTSPLKTRSDAPRQPDEGAPAADVVVEERFRPALDGITVGDRVLLLTWLHHGDRDVLSTRPRNDESRPITGVFATRSPDRPNPIGLHAVEVLGVEGAVLHVRALEAIDGTPVLDIKPVLGDAEGR